jgi:mercuric ion transport protein
MNSRPIVELVYAVDCPNVSGARAHLRQAFDRVGWAAQWVEHDVGDASIPEHARGRGSPTVLVDGRDVSEAEGCGGARCRLYRDEEGRLSGVPPVEEIVAALVRGGVGVTVR